jgi:hypothetical protein
MGQARACKEGIRYAYKIFVGKPKERKALQTPTRRWVDNIKINLKVFNLSKKIPG